MITALTVVGGAYVLAAFNEDYALVGRITSWIYLLGAIGICLMPTGVGGEIKEYQFIRTLEFYDTNRVTDFR